MTAEPILIVDDNPQNLKLARVLLAREGYEVRTAVNAEEALQTLASFFPRLILTDQQLPGMDGIELARKLKTDPAWRKIIVVALTAYGTKRDRDKAMAAGCDAYMSKPIDTEAFPRVIAELLARTAPDG